MDSSIYSTDEQSLTDIWSIMETLEANHGPTLQQIIDFLKERINYSSINELTAIVREAVSDGINKGLIVEKNGLLSINKLDRVLDLTNVQICLGKEEKKNGVRKVRSCGYKKTSRAQEKQKKCRRRSTRTSAAKRSGGKKRTKAVHEIRQSVLDIAKKNIQKKQLKCKTIIKDKSLKCDDIKIELNDATHISIVSSNGNEKEKQEQLENDKDENQLEKDKDENQLENDKDENQLENDKDENQLSVPEPSGRKRRILKRAAKLQSTVTDGYGDNVEQQVSTTEMSATKKRGRKRKNRQRKDKKNNVMENGDSNIPEKQSEPECIEKKDCDQSEAMIVDESENEQENEVCLDLKKEEEADKLPDEVKESEKDSSKSKLKKTNTKS